MSERQALLGEICEFRYGKSLPAQLREPGHVPVFGSNGPVGTHKDALLNGPAIIIGRKGSYGEVHFAGGPAWPIDTTYYVDRSTTDCDLHWLHYLLKFLPLTSLNKSAAIPGLNREDAYRLPVRVPSLPEQRRVASILDKADALRRKRKRAIELLDSLTQSIFLEMFGDAKHLPTKPLGTALSRPLRNGLSPAKSGSIKSKVLTLSAITGKVFKEDAVKEADFTAESPASQRVAEGDFLICRGNGNKSLVGVGVTAPFSMPDTTFPDTIIAGRIDDHWFDSHYFEHVWNSPVVRRQIEQSARTTNGTFKVNQQVLERVEIPLPDSRLQTEFGLRVTSINSQLARNQNQLEYQHHLFASLQSRAFSGQL